MWLDDCRIPFVDEDKHKINFDRPRLRNKEGTDWILTQAMDYTNPDYKEYNQQGRFTPNLLVCDDMLNDGVVHQSGKVKEHHKRNKTLGEYQGNAYGKFNNETPDLNYDAYYGDKGSSSRYYDLDLWFDKMVDRL
jgi:hypothetical protein